MGIHVLGPLALDGTNGLGFRDRVVLEALVVCSDAPVVKDVLAEALYGDTPPPSWPKVVQGSVARLRKILGASAIETTPYGYQLRIHEEELDTLLFQRLLHRAREQLLDHEPDRASFLLAEALALWRGRALPDLDEWEPGRTEAARLEALRLDAQELRVEAEVAAGRARQCLDEARTLVSDAPYREHRWGLFARALYQVGRQTESLDVLASARRMLRQELGLDPGEELSSLEAGILRQDPGLVGSDPVQVNASCPYRGLLAYRPEDEDAFFGRETDVAACLRLLREAGVLFLVGPSGVGKSSVIRAGVVPALRRDGAEVVLTTPGERPLDSLPRPPHGSARVLVVDQAEEAVIWCHDAEERSEYFRQLAQYPGPLVVALRSDHLGDLASHPEFVRLSDRGFHLLATLSEASLRSVVEGPARQAGLRLEPGLVDLLVREVQDEPGALPLLSHVLRATWQHREGRTLTVNGYRMTGGVRDAVAQTAERLHARLEDQGRRDMRTMFLRLLVPGVGGVATRVRVSREQLAVDPSHEDLIEALVASRLLSSDDNVVQVAHEALARAWPRLRRWLDEDVEGQRTLHHLTASAQAWEQLGRPASELYRGVRLAGVLEWAGRQAGDLTPREQEFLRASREQSLAEQKAEREQLMLQRRANRRLRLSLAGVGLLLVVATVSGTIATQAERRARDEAAAADAAARMADSRRLAAQALVLREPDLSLLVGVESTRRDDSILASTTLYSLLGKTSRVIGVARGRAGFETVDVSPDGRTVLAGSPTEDGLSRYQGVSLRQRSTRTGIGATAVAFSPDGRTVAVAGGWFGSEGARTPLPGPLQLLDADTLTTKVRFGGTRGGTHVADSVDFGADGTRVAGVVHYGSQVVEAVVWDVHRPRSPLVRFAMNGGEGSVQLGPRGERLYLAQRGEPLRLVDTRTGAVLSTRTSRFSGDGVPALALSPDGSLLATSHADGIAVRDARTLTVRFVLSGVVEGVSALAFSRDGTRVAAGHPDGTAVVWDLSRRKPVETLKGHSQEVGALAFSPDGDTLYSVAFDRQLLAWDLTGGRGFPPWRRFSEQPRAQNVFAALPSPDGRSVAYLAHGPAGGTSQLQFRDLASGRLTPLKQLAQVSPPQPFGVWSPDSQLFVTGGDESELPGQGATRAGTLQSWEPSSGRLVRENRDSGVYGAEFAPDGEHLVAVTNDSTVQRIEARSLQPLGDPIRIGTGATKYYPMLLTPDGGHAILLEQFGTSSVVVGLASERTVPVTLPNTPFSLALSPDGSRLALYDTRGEWGVLDVVKLLRGQLSWRMAPREFRSNIAWHLVWSSDGEHIVTTGSGVVDVWDAATLSHLGSLSAGSADDVAVAEPMDDGHTFVIARPRGEVLTWDLRPQHLVDVACSLAGRNLTEPEWEQAVGGGPYRKTCTNASIASGLGGG